MQKALQHFQNTIGAIDSGAVNPGIVGACRVKCYEQNMLVTHLAAITQPEYKNIYIIPYDLSVLNQIEKALKSQGFEVYKMSKEKLCISVPARSQEERIKVVKKVRSLAEETKVAIRNIRKKQRKGLTGSDEEVKNEQEKIDKSTKQYINLVDEITRIKIGHINPPSLL